LGVFEELKRRNVFRVAVPYAIGAWLIAQIADLVLDNTSAPNWVMQVLFLLLAIGFVVVLIISWAYEVTPDGIKRERDVIRDESITHLTARKLDYITVAAALGVAGMLGWQQFTGGQASYESARLGAHSIAVLPFANRSNRDDDLFFTDGIHDDLLTQLAKIDDLKVISRTSVMEYRDTTKKIPQIANELGVAIVLEGGVQRAGQRIRINAQLIDVATDQHLWAETFDREMTVDNLFDIQSEITRHIISAVKGQMSEREQGTLATAPTESVPAYEAYLRARQVMASSGYNMEKYQAAQPLLEEAIALDPDFALAHLVLANIHGYASWIGYGDSASRKRQARVAIDRAATILEPNAPELLAARGGYLYRFERDFAGALQAQTEAAAAMPGDVVLLADIGTSQRRLGLWDEAIESMLAAYELDPAAPDAVSMAADTMLLHHDFDRLRNVLSAARERFPYDTDLAVIHAMLPLRAEGDVKTARQRYDAVRPDTGLNYVLASVELPWYERDFETAIEAWDKPEVRALTSTAGWSGVRELYQGMAWRKLGDEERARVMLTAALNSEIDGSLDSANRAALLGTRAWALVLLGETERAIAAAEEAVRLHSYDDDKVEGLVPLQNLCFVLARAGKRDEALALVPQLLDQPNGLSRWHVYLDPRWDFFRDDERFNELIRPHNLERIVPAKKRGPH